MGYIVRMPKLGLEMEQGTLIEWVIDPGEEVSTGDTVAEIESEKTTAEVESREDGVLRTVFVEMGETVPPGTPIGIVAGAEEDISELETEAATDLDGGAEEGSEEARAGSEAGGESAATEAAATTGSDPSTGSGSAGGSVKASPRAKKRAEELGVDLAAVEGSGPGGAVTEEDVEAAAESGGGEATESGAVRTVVDEVEFSGMRRTIATRLSESYRNAVHVTVHREVEAGELRAAAAAAESTLGVDVSVTDVLLVALSATLDEHPEFNATYEDDVHRIYAEHNIAMAVDIEAGLVAPVVPDVGGRSLADLAETRREITGRTLDGEYTMGDLQGGTFTVTNLGVLGVESFDPVINPPQVAILGVNAFVERARSAEDGGVAVRRVLPLDLSFDHRVVDGADAARFLGTLAGHLEDPWPLLPEEVRAERGERSGAAVELPHRRVSATSHAGMAGTVQAGSFTWEFGGEDAPDPVDIFAGALGACLTGAIRYQFDMRDHEVGEIEADVTAEPESGSVESLDIAVTIDAPDVEEELLDRAVRNGERTCHVAELLREDLPVTVAWERASGR